MKPSHLPIAVRALTVPVNRKKRRRRRDRKDEPPRWTKYVLILDTETTTDRTQRLLFGSYRVGTWDERGRLVIVEEGLFYGDDLPKRDRKGFTCLKRYAGEHMADLDEGHAERLRLYSRSDFVKRVLYPLLCKAGAQVVGFNLPFDLSRVAVRASAGRYQNRRAFSLIVFDHAGGESQYRPRIRVISRNSRSAFITLGRVRRPQGREYEPGRFLDLRTLTHALTNEGHTLASACAAFGVEHGKTKAEGHGVITSAYIDYNRRDVRASQELLERLRAEFDRHPIPLQPDRAYSPASVAKGYLDAMGLQPIARKSGLSRHQIGAAMSAYFGGRAEVHVRRVAVPVVYLDFLSMYPTISSLLDLWPLHIAEEVMAQEATAEVRELLAGVTLDACFDQVFWKRLNFFALVQTEGDVLPVRAQYGVDGAFGIGINPLTSKQPLWCAGPDLLASTLLTGRPPKIRKTFRIVGTGRQDGLHPVSIRGTVRIDPAEGDFFQRTVELRKRVTQNPDVSPDERRWLSSVLKTIGNSGAYGIQAEFNRQDGQKPTELAVYAGHRPFRTQTKTPEKAGRFCYPPVATFITAGARLMLAVLERCVTDLGGTWAFCDTDSMAIVASKDGGPVPCPTADGSGTIHALSWPQVDQIVERFASLSPYDRDVIPGSILKVESVNFDPETGARRQIECFAISAKRYALFVRSPEGSIQLVEQKEHGLGHLLNPLDPDLREEAGTRSWIRELWLYIVERALGRNPSVPAWLHRPALSRLAITDPSLLNAFRGLDGDLEYADRVKPFNFALAAHVRPLGHPSDVDPTHFQLMAPYEADPRRWKTVPWINRYTGEEFAITTVGDTGGPGIARVRTYADVLVAYDTHPEVKSLGRNRAAVVP